MSQGLDINSILERLDSILQNDSQLKEIISEFRIGETGDGKDKDFAHYNPPAIIISTPQRPFLTRENFGRSTDSDTQKTIQLNINVITKTHGTSQDAKLSLFDLIGHITRILESNPTLKDTTGYTPKLTRSFVADVIENENMRGNMMQSATILFQGTIGIQDSISFIDVTELQEIQILDRPNETHIENTENLYNTARQRKGVATINEVDTFFCKLEYTKSRWDKLYEIYAAKNTVSFTITRYDHSQIRQGRLTNLSNGAGYDTMETILIQIEIF